MKVVYGEVSDIKLVRSRSVVIVSIEVPIEAHRAVVNLLELGASALLMPASLDSPFGVTGGEPVESKQETPNETKKHPGGFGHLGPLCSLAVRWCKDEHFRTWASSLSGIDIDTEDDASTWIKSYCDVDSRSDIDGNRAAAERFSLLRKMYMDSAGKNGVA